MALLLIGLALVAWVMVGLVVALAVGGAFSAKDRVREEPALPVRLGR